MEEKRNFWLPFMELNLIPTPKPLKKHLPISGGMASSLAILMDTKTFPKNKKKSGQKILWLNTGTFFREAGLKSNEF